MAKNLAKRTTITPTQARVLESARALVHCVWVPTWHDPDSGGMWHNHVWKISLRESHADYLAAPDADYDYVGSFPTVGVIESADDALELVVAENGPDGYSSGEMV